jgi:L-threonylcarbamoyladenylate synthase
MLPRHRASAISNREPYRPLVTCAARILQAGGIVAYPTEGVFGIGCLPDDLDAVRRILAVKQRSWRKGLALIAASIEQLEPLVELPGGAMRAQILATWPGPATWVLPVRVRECRLLTGGRGTLAVRVTAHPVARALCAKAGSALVSTSANRTRRAPLRSALAVRRRLGADVDFVLGGALGGLSGPTPIRDGRNGAILRPGA